MVGKIFFTHELRLRRRPRRSSTTDLQTAMDPMFNDGHWLDPGCWMQKIPIWYGPDFFPDQPRQRQPTRSTSSGDATSGSSRSRPSTRHQKDAEGSADSLMVLVDRPEVRAVAEFLATPEGLEGWIKRGSALSANTTTPAEWYAGNYKLKVATDIVSSATGIGFDASDLMPRPSAPAPSGPQSVDWVNANGTNTDAVLKAIDDSWPSQ